LFDETAAKISRAVARRGKASGRGTHRRRESVRSDSGVLRLAEVVEAPAERSGAKLFLRDESAGGGGVTPVKSRANGAERARLRDNSALREVVESRIPSALLRDREFFMRADAAAEFFCRVIYCGARRDRRRERGAALTHKIKQSHCYFFPAVVIGMQCWSIRDRTVPMSPSTQA